MTNQTQGWRKCFKHSQGATDFRIQGAASPLTSSAYASGCRCHGNPGREASSRPGLQRSVHYSSTVPPRPDSCLGIHASLCWSNQVMCGLMTDTQRVACHSKNLCRPCPQTQCRKQVRVGRHENTGGAQDQYAYYQLHGDNADLEEREQAWLPHSRCEAHPGFNSSEGEGKW